MKILAIETSSNVCAVALLENDNLIKEKIIEDKNTHSIKLMPLISNLLEDTKTNLEDIDLFACDKGPGSFTGIRIGIATVKAFADVTNKKTIGISSLDILAHNVKQNGIICAMLDAKNENIYYGIFEKNDEDIIQIDESKFNNITDALKEISNLQKTISFVGDASESYRKQIQEKLEEKAMFVDENKLNARNIGLIAFNKKQQAGNSDCLTPTYLRKSNAER